MNTLSSVGEVSVGTPVAIAAKPLPAIREILMHQNPHLDEICGYFLLLKYGEKKFPGISEAAIRFVEGEVVGTDEQFDRDGILPIGCGKGRFDEHRGSLERLPGECATTLIAQYVGLNPASNPELVRIIEEVLYFDTHAGCAPTQLSELVKTAHRTDKDNYEVMHWTMIALTSIVRQQQFRFAKVQSEVSLVQVMRSSVKEGLYEEDDRVRKYMFDHMHRSERQKSESVTELASIVEALYRNGHNSDAVSTWLVTPMDRMVLDQLEFWKEVEKLKSLKVIEVRALINRQTGWLKILAFQSDSLQAQRAARYIGVQVIIVRNSTGNIQVYTDATIEGLSLSNVARMIRWLELPLSKKNMSWSGLGCEGKYAEVDHWYYFKKGEMLFNGSHTNVATPTHLTLGTMVDIMRLGFTPDGVAHWCNQRGIQKK